MKIVIDIPEDMYDCAQKGYLCGSPIIVDAIRNGTPYEERPQGDLISRTWLKEHKFTTQVCNGVEIEDVDVVGVATIDNALTVEVPENTVNCVLTMFGKCSYNETGCSDCEIKDKIRKALNARPQGEWIKHIRCIECSVCKNKFFADDEDENCQDYEPCTDLRFNFCPNCGADMRGGRDGT